MTIWVMRYLAWFLLLATIGWKSVIPLKNEAFVHGEKLKFSVSYSFVEAGEITLEVLPVPSFVAKRECYHIIGKGRTVGALDLFFKVRDYFETNIDKETMVPLIFIRKVHEGNYSLSQYSVFNHPEKRVVTEKGNYSVPPGIQDVLSAFYFARCRDYSFSRPGDIFPLAAFMDYEVTPLDYKFLGREKIKMRKGYINALKFGPRVVKGRVFRKEEDMVMWVSDDKLHIPLRIEAHLRVGTLKAELEEWSGLRSPLNFSR